MLLSCFLCTILKGVGKYNVVFFLHWLASTYVTRENKVVPYFNQANNEKKIVVQLFRPQALTDLYIRFFQAIYKYALKVCTSAGKLYFYGLFEIHNYNKQFSFFG